MRAIATASLFVLMLLGCNSGNGSLNACTEIGCIDGMNVPFEHTGTWTAGTYKFELVIDGKADSCQAKLPMANCDTVPSNSCTSSDLTLGLSGCALPASEQSISNLWIARKDFKSLSIKVTLNNSTLTQQTLAPTWQTSQPNGPGCEPICTQAGTTSLKF